MLKHISETEFVRRQGKLFSEAECRAIVATAGRTSCHPSDVNEAVRTVTAPAVSGPGAGIPCKHHDCSGVPLHVGDNVVCHDGVLRRIIALEDDGMLRMRSDGMRRLYVHPSLVTYVC
jgi:hypothetical protein